jgi:hypothetical protein
MTRSSRADRSPPGDSWRSLDRTGPESCRVPEDVPGQAAPPPQGSPFPGSRNTYIAALLQLYLEQPDTPAVPRRGDRAVAADLHDQGAPLATIAHAIRLATLRRHLRDPAEPPLPPIRSLAYYRRVLDSLTSEELEPGYAAYLATEHARLLARLRTPPRSAPKGNG